jgi:hypothetical protein
MSLNPPPLRIIRSHALSGSLTVAPELICVAPTAITNGHDAGKEGLNLFASRPPEKSSNPRDMSLEFIIVLFSGHAHHWSFGKLRRIQLLHDHPNYTKQLSPITQAYRNGGLMIPQDSGSVNECQIYAENTSRLRTVVASG